MATAPPSQSRVDNHRVLDVTDLDRCKTSLEALAEAWDAVGYRCGDAPAPGSPCDIETHRLAHQVERPDTMLRTIAGDCALYVSAASQQLRALAKLMGPEIVLSGWPLVRSAVEHCGRVAWLLGSVDEPRDRVARFYMEWIASTHYARMAARTAGLEERAAEHKADRTRAIQSAREIFPDAAMPNHEDKIGDWEIGGQRYKTLGGAVRLLQERMNTTGLYATLSAVTHPSVTMLQGQIRTTDLGDKKFMKFQADVRVIHWQAAVAGGAVYCAGSQVAQYLRIDDTELEHWADAHEDLLQA